jgi:hypothetical protein
MASSACPSRALSGVIRGGTARITGHASGGIVQQYQIAYETKRVPQYDLISTNFYYIEYPHNGTAKFTSVVTTSAGAVDMCSCSPQTITVTPTQLCDGSVGGAYTLANALPSGVQIQSSVNDWLVMFSVDYTFSELRTS